MRRENKHSIVDSLAIDRKMRDKRQIVLIMLFDSELDLFNHKNFILISFIHPAGTFGSHVAIKLR